MTVLYRFYDADHELLYIGISASPLSRWDLHSYGSTWWPAARYVTLAHLDTWKKALAAERAAIEAERPLFNREYPHRNVSVSPDRDRQYSGQAVFEDLRAAIAGCPADSCLPTIPQLSSAYRVSQSTIKNVLRKLKAADLVIGQQGKAVYVADHPPTSSD